MAPGNGSQYEPCINHVQGTLTCYIRGIKVTETPGFVFYVSGTFGIWGLFRCSAYRKGFPVVERVGLSRKSIWFGRGKMIVGVQFKALSTFRCAKDSTDQGDSEGTNPSVAPSALRDKWRDECLQFIVLEKSDINVIHSKRDKSH